MKALVIGGTGPTGPHLIRGLLGRGYDVTMLNRGSRDSDAIPPEVERVKGDPHFPDTLDAAETGLSRASRTPMAANASVAADQADRWSRARAICWPARAAASAVFLFQACHS